MSTYLLYYDYCTLSARCSKRSSGPSSFMQLPDIEMSCAVSAQLGYSAIAHGMTPLLCSAKVAATGEDSRRSHCDETGKASSSAGLDARNESPSNSVDQ
jgi:hypothetical protein